MKKTIVALSIIALVFTSCNKGADPFLVQNQNIGLLTDSTQVKELKTIYANDSIISPIGGDEFSSTLNTIEIYEKGGKHLLSLTPKQLLDSTATISSIIIKDARFKTDKGITSASTFGDIKAKYTITKIQNSFKSASIFVKESDAFFLIDKKELPAEFRFDIKKTIESANIPDTAKIKSFMLGW
ncbi:hypothetical protein [Olleya sp. HaHaR_3_96]|uniref:hypothetical protein n=1 Tax=Olleya sp. HaHaR_3_96 TaxID=2745560 RepID=UPI001C4EB3F3|nr:hypothetical protein [Olleya sp. HaHaR_3_96]QXP59818.1 hypothetical protein H0I26_18210 [Olleya sp. HaHaR_3_96]